MANLYVTGPVHLYVSTAAFNNSSATSSSGTAGTSLMSCFFTYPSTIYYLGTCQEAPRLAIEPQFKPVYADIGGNQIPFDQIFMGEEAGMMGVLNHWNEYVYRMIAARPAVLNPASSTRGTGLATDVGTMMLSEGKAFCLWAHFPYYGKAFGSQRHMPAGYRFPAAIMIGPDEIEGGTKAGKRFLRFKFCRVYKASDGSWLTYDHTMTNIPAIPPTGVTGLVS